jgi:hypothetical protein
MDGFKAAIGVAAGEREIIGCLKAVIHDLLHQLPPRLPLPLLSRLLPRLLFLSELADQYHAGFRLQPLDDSNLLLALRSRNAPVKIFKLYV